MSVYMIATYDIEDPAAHETYAMAADPVLEKHGGKILIADDKSKPIEGSGGQVSVVIEFPSESSVMNFYNDPTYQSLKEIRLASTTNSCVVLAAPYAPL